MLFLDAGSRKACEGGLQEQKVRDEICKIMEGGREAFKSRYRRIMSLERTPRPWHVGFATSARMQSWD